MCWKLDLGFCEDTLSTLKQYGIILLDAKHKQILYSHRVINIAFVSETWAFIYVSGQRIVHGQIRDKKDALCFNAHSRLLSSASPCNTDWSFIYQNFNLQN
jgi:hypothetical protein